jgi:hypothetical protein
MTRKISIPDLHWYAARLLAIPLVLDEGPGRERCRQIGAEIFERYDKAGMVKVCEFVRNEFDSRHGSHIERAWDRIGTWRG